MQWRDPGTWNWYLVTIFADFGKIYFWIRDRASQDHGNVLDRCAAHLFCDFLCDLHPQGRNLSTGVLVLLEEKKCKHSVLQRPWQPALLFAGAVSAALQHLAAATAKSQKLRVPSSAWPKKNLPPLPTIRAQCTCLGLGIKECRIRWRCFAENQIFIPKGRTCNNEIW